jgi:hypothetical protein
MSEVTEVTKQDSEKISNVFVEEIDQNEQITLSSSDKSQSKESDSAN